MRKLLQNMYNFLRWAGCWDRRRHLYGVQASLPVPEDTLFWDSMCGFSDAFKLYKELVQMVDYKSIPMEDFFVNVDEDKFHDHINERRYLCPIRLQEWELQEPEQ